MSIEMDWTAMTIQQARLLIATYATRANHIFDRIITSDSPSTPVEKELMLVSGHSMMTGHALAAVLEEAERRDPKLADELLKVVVAIMQDGPDGWGEDLHEEVQSVLSRGGIGTPQWDAANQ